MSENTDYTETTDLTPEAPETEAANAPVVEATPKRTRRTKAIVAVSIVMAVIGAGLVTLSLPPVQDAIVGAFEQQFNAGQTDEKPAPKDEAEAEEPSEEDIEAAEAAERADLVKTLAGGDAITEEQAMLIKRDWQADPGAYQLADGSWVFIRKSEPLPEVVKKDVASRVTSKNPGNVDSMEVVGFVGEVRDIAAATSSSVGKSVFVVVQVYTFTPTDSTVRARWIGYSSRVNVTEARDTAEQAVADVTRFAAENGTENYEIVIAN